MNNLKKEFCSYVIPSVFSFALTGLYCFADAFFVGNMVGEKALAAINIIFCFLSVVIAVGSGIGMGSAVKIQIARSRNEDFSCYIASANTLLFVFSIALLIPMLLFPTEIMMFLGTSENVAKIGLSYFRINALGSIFQIYGCALIPICRNLGKIKASVASMVAGNVLNILLDWLFVWVFNWDMKGAAWATVIGQITGFLICFVSMLKTGDFVLGKTGKKFFKYAREILTIGISPFGLTVVPNISITIINRASLSYGGETGISAYGCISYLTYVIYLVLQGVSDGSQPLISRYYALNDHDKELYTKKLTYRVSLYVAGAALLLYVVARKFLSTLMGAEPVTAAIIESALPVFATGFLFVAVSRTSASNLYACEKNIRSYIISYAEPVFILAAVLFLAPTLKLNGVWLSSTLGQLAVMLLSISLILQKQHQ